MNPVADAPDPPRSDAPRSSDASRPSEPSMAVTVVTPSLSRDAGGIFDAERRLAQSLDALDGVSVDVHGLEDAHTADDLPAWRPLAPTVHPVRGPAAFGYAPTLPGALDAAGGDLVHLHALWMYTSLATLRWTRRTGRPHLVSVHGMLDPWAVQNARWKKRVVGWLYENASLRRAACLHALNAEEHDAIRAYGVDTPVCVVPNGVDLPSEPPPERPPWTATIPDDARVLLFLGRLHPKKGLAELFAAWDAVRDAREADAWHLAVVGWDDGGHDAELQRTVDRLGLGDTVHLLGPMFDADKAAAFAHADAFVLPSFSEGLPMAVLEAWSYRLPVLMTPACNLPDGFAREAALRIDPDADAIAEGLRRLSATSPDARAAMGRRGRALVEDRFTWDRVARQMRGVYAWLLDRAPRPDCVRTSG